MAARYPCCAVLMWLHGVVRRRYVAGRVRREEESGRVCTYTNEKFIVICKPRTLNDGGEDSVKYRNRKKHRFLAAAILLFIGKIIIT